MRGVATRGLPLPHPSSMTVAEFNALAKPKKPSKYRAVPTVVDGVRFASKKEARRDAELHLLAKADGIRALTRQPKYELYVEGRKIGLYIGDWRYWERTGKPRPSDWALVVEDCKGVKTPAFKLKWKLAQALHRDVHVWRLS